jgi:hypothetical protein
VRRAAASFALAMTAALGLAAPLAGCGNACSALSEKICECRPNQPERNACVEQIRLSEIGKDEVSEAEAAACEARLETCTCESIEDGALAACGLAP